MVLMMRDNASMPAGHIDERESLTLHKITISSPACKRDGSDEVERALGTQHCDDLLILGGGVHLHKTS